MTKRISWNLEFKKASDLKPYNKNPRIITDSSVEELRKSFDEIGEAQPINVNQDLTILSGHARHKVLMSEDPERMIAVYIPDRLLTPKQEEAVIIRMNKNIAGKWDFEKLQSEFDLNDLMDWGFTEQELTIPEMPEIDLSDKNKEINTDNFGDDLQHQCPKCGFEFNE